MAGTSKGGRDIQARPARQRQLTTNHDTTAVDEPAPSLGPSSAINYTRTGKPKSHIFVVRIINVLPAMEIDDGINQGLGHPEQHITCHNKDSGNFQAPSMMASASSCCGWQDQQEEEEHVPNSADSRIKASFYGYRSRHIARDSYGYRIRNQGIMNTLQTLQERVLEGKIRPKALMNRVDSYITAGIIPRRLADEVKQNQHSFLAAKAACIEKARGHRLRTIDKAKDKVRTEVLERALASLQLHVEVTTTPAKQLPAGHIIMTLPYATAVIQQGSELAEKALDNFRRSLEDPVFIDTLSSDDRRRMMFLQKHEEGLRAKMKDVGSIQAALVYQEEKIALFNEAQVSREESLHPEEGVSDGMDEEPLLPEASFSRVPKLFKPSMTVVTPIVPQEVSDAMTTRQKFIDQQTAEDFEAYKQNSKLDLPRRRRNRLQTALSCGRTDLCAMDVERQRMTVPVFRKHEKKRMAEQALELLLQKGRDGVIDGRGRNPLGVGTRAMETEQRNLHNEGHNYIDLKDHLTIESSETRL
ncbi:MAG: hypothetical protein Q9213_006926 [Squamulea squamosa]